MKGRSHNKAWTVNCANWGRWYLQVWLIRKFVAEIQEKPEGFSRTRMVCELFATWGNLLFTFTWSWVTSQAKSDLHVRLQGNQECARQRDSCWIELKAGPLGEAILAANSRAKFDVTTWLPKIWEGKGQEFSWCFPHGILFYFSFVYQLSVGWCQVECTCWKEIKKESENITHYSNRWFPYHP